MATAAYVQFGIFEGKDIVNKNVTFDPQISLPSSHVRNYEITPAGGTIRIVQDIFTTGSDKIYNYCRYVIGDLVYYGYAECTGSAGGIVTYQITNDAATTMWKAGAFNINNYCRYSPLGDRLYNDTRRARAAIPERIKRQIQPGSVEALWVNDNILNGCIVINITSIPLAHNISRCISTTPANVNTYVLDMTAFYNFYKNISEWNDASKPIAAYIKSILNITWLPLSPENIINLNSFEVANERNVYLWNPADFTAVTINCGNGKLYDLRKASGALGLYAQTPEISLQDLNTSETRYAEIEYNSFGFGLFKFSAERLPGEAIESISTNIYLDLSGLSYRAVPVIKINSTDAELNELSSIGTFTCQIPMLSETDISNWQLRESMLRRDTGFAVVTSSIGTIAAATSGNIVGAVSGILTGAERLIGAAAEQKQIEWDKRFSGGTILNSLGSALQRVYDMSGYVTLTYYPYRSPGFASVFNYPDHELRNIYTSFGQQIGYIQTVNCNILRLGYPETIARAAEQAFDAGLWVT